MSRADVVAGAQPVMELGCDGGGGGSVGAQRGWPKTCLCKVLLLKKFVKSVDTPSHVSYSIFRTLQTHEL